MAYASQLLIIDGPYGASRCWLIMRAIWRQNLILLSIDIVGPFQALAHGSLNREQRALLLGKLKNAYFSMISGSQNAAIIPVAPYRTVDSDTKADR